MDKWLSARLAQRMAIQRRRSTPPHNRPDWRSYHSERQQGLDEMNPTKGLTEEEIAKAKEILATRQPPVETRAATGPTQAQIAEMMQKLDEIAALMRQLLAKISAPQT